MFAFVRDALRSLKSDQRGIAALEYGVIAGVVTAIVAVGVADYGIAIHQMLIRLANQTRVIIPT